MDDFFWGVYYIGKDVLTFLFLLIFAVPAIFIARYLANIDQGN